SSPADADVDPVAGIRDRQELRVLPEPGGARLEAVAIERPAQGVDVAVDREGLTERAVLDGRDVEAGEAGVTRCSRCSRIAGPAAHAHETDREAVHGPPGVRILRPRRSEAGSEGLLPEPVREVALAAVGEDGDDRARRRVA